MMGNVIANNPGQISELARRSALYRARAYETKGLQLLRQNKKEEAKGNFRIAIKIFDRTLGKNILISVSLSTALFTFINYYNI